MWGTKKINGICYKGTVGVHTEKVDVSWFFENNAIGIDIKSGKL